MKVRDEFKNASDRTIVELLQETTLLADVRRKLSAGAAYIEQQQMQRVPMGIIEVRKVELEIAMSIIELVQGNKPRGKETKKRT
jgi:hypothetical protein